MKHFVYRFHCSITASEIGRNHFSDIETIFLHSILLRLSRALPNHQFSQLLQKKVFKRGTPHTQPKNIFILSTHRKNICPLFSIIKFHPMLFY